MYENKSHALTWPQQEKKIKMGAAKFVALLTGSFNIMLYILAWFANLDNIKSTILFIVALCMSLYRFYRWAIRDGQNKRLKDLTIQEKELDIIKQREGLREVELEHRERALALQIQEKMLNRDKK